MIAAVAAAPARRTRTPVLGEEGRAGQLCGAADTGSAMRDEIGACHARRRCDRSGPAEKARGMHVSVRGSCDGPAFVDFRDADDLGQHNVEIASSDGRDPLRHRCDAIISSGAARVRQRAPSFGLVPRNKPRSTTAAACKARGHRRRLDVGWPRAFDIHIGRLDLRPIFAHFAPDQQRVRQVVHGGSVAGPELGLTSHASRQSRNSRRIYRHLRLG
jgi:hypothetical protein